MKSIISIISLVLIIGLAVECRPKRSVILTAPVVQAASVVPVVRTHSVVHSSPTTVVKTEQVHGGDHSSYSYSTEVKSSPVVHTHAAVVAAPVASVATVTHHAVPTYSYGYYPASYYYSPYNYVIGK